MRLLFITEFFPQDKKNCFTGGVEARTFFISQKLRKKNKVFIINRQHKSQVAASLLSIFSRLVFMLIAFFKALKLDFDLVEGSNFVCYLPAFLAAKIKNKKAVAWYADVLGKDWFKYFGLTGCFGFIMEKASLLLSWDRIIALSNSTKQKLVRQGISKAKIDVIYGGVDLNEFKGSSASKVHQLQKNQNIICIARLVKYKRIEDLILAFAKLSKKYAQWNLTIIGQGPEERKLKSLILEKNLETKVKFYKNLARKKLVKLLQTNDLFCLPSLIEGFGLVTIEAAACGLPFVISNIKVHQEISLGGQGGLFFKKTDINDLVEQIEKILNDQKLYQRKSRQALLLAKKYSWDKIALDTQNIYQKSLNE